MMNCEQGAAERIRAPLNSICPYCQEHKFWSGDRPCMVNRCRLGNGSDQTAVRYELTRTIFLPKKRKIFVLIAVMRCTKQ